MSQLELHKEISKFFMGGTNTASATIALKLINSNRDAKRFFFASANEDWLDWLWKNNFLEKLKEKTDGSNHYAYDLPELDYLARIVDTSPKVADVINSIEISEANFNPNVVNGFLWIITSMPAEQIKTLTKKIRDEEWLRLMHNSKSGYDFVTIIEKLTEKKEYSAILELAEAILTVFPEKNLETSGFRQDGPFCIEDVNASGVLQALVAIDPIYREKALQISIKALGDVIRLSSKDSAEVFEYDDSFALHEVDFFRDELQNSLNTSYSVDTKNLALAVKDIIRQAIEGKCDNKFEAQKLLDYVNSLPDSRLRWRLSLFTLVQCPNTFIKELQDSLFKLFEVENYYKIEDGTEYKKALSVSFQYLSEDIRQEYISKLFSYFSKKIIQNPKQLWHKRVGLEILSNICEFLNKEALNKCEVIFEVRCNESHKVEPIVVEREVGFISHRSPADITLLSIEDIIINLKTIWTPESLASQFKDDDYFSPRGVEGLGDALKEDIKKRPDPYLQNIGNFFVRDTIAPHYLWSLLYGIEEILRDKKTLSNTQVDQLIGLFMAIRDEGIDNAFNKEENKSWLADWISVHKSISDILLYILENKQIRDEVYSKYKTQLKDIISYLFTIKDSPSTDMEKPEYGDLHHVAINSVRGRAYEVFVVFIEVSGKTLSRDVKDVYKQILNDKSLAVRFMIGRYLASFYFRDKEFIRDLLPRIFPKTKSQELDIYLATWEGYLSNTLYDKLFVELKEYYLDAITLDSSKYPDRKYVNGLDEALAVHLALAFAQLGLNMADDLFVRFWNTSNTIRHHEFISFIGRSMISRDIVDDQWFRDNRVSKERLIGFWDWTLANENLQDPKIFSGYGFWINPNKEILEDSILLQKVNKILNRSQGDIDWDYGLLQRLVIFAKINPDITLEIIQSYLLNSDKNINQNRRTPLGYNHEIRDALKIIYLSDERQKQKVMDLVDILIEKGSSNFWSLKEIIPIKVIKVFKKQFDIDGFTAELEDGRSLDISGTQWNTADNKREYGDETLFIINKYNISFSKENTEKANQM